MFTSLLKDVIKGAGNQPDKSEVWEGPQVQALLSSWQWGGSPCPHVDVFTHPEALQIPYYWDFLLLSFCLFRAVPAAYGGSQARGLIGAVATSLQHRHSNTRSEPCL